jgi:hypothetical protein
MEEYTLVNRGETHNTPLRGSIYGGGDNFLLLMFPLISFGYKVLVARTDPSDFEKKRDLRLAEIGSRIGQEKCVNQSQAMCGAPVLIIYH